MSPPWPPLPPSGPARGLNFSRRTETQPWPPWPARRWRVTRSTKVVIRSLLSDPGADMAKGRAVARPFGKLARRGRSGRRDDVDDLAAALGAELDGTRREREQRVVATAADVDARVELGAALTDEDLAGLD